MFKNINSKGRINQSKCIIQTTKFRAKELSLCHKLKFANPSFLKPVKF